MKKADKEKIIKMVTEKYGKYFSSLRFRTTEDISYVSTRDGWFTPSTKEIVIKQNDTVETLAHELAHALQFHVRNETTCKSAQYKKNYNEKLSDEHSIITENIMIQFSNNGIEEAWNTAINMFPRVTKSNIGKELKVVC
jgi:hypothetical protein